MTRPANLNSSVWGPYLRAGRDDVLPLHVAELQMPTAPAVIDAVTSFARSGQYGYTEPFDEFGDIVTEWCARRYDWQIDPTRVVMVPRVVELLAILARDFFDKPPRVITFTPAYFPTLDVLECNGCEIIRLPLAESDGRWRIDHEVLRKALRAGVDMLMLCSPHNPTGEVWSRDDLRKVAIACAETDTLVVADEVHADLAHSRRFVPFGAVAPPGTRWFSCLAPGKAFNLAGLETSAIVCADRALADQLHASLRAHGFHNANAFGLLALQTAWSQGDDWLDTLNEHIRQNIDHAVSVIEKHLPGLRPIPPTGTFLLWIDASAVGGRTELYDWFVKRAHVIPGFGADFGPGYDGWIRLNIGLHPDELHSALQRLVQTAPTSAAYEPRASDSLSRSRGRNAASAFTTEEV